MISALDRLELLVDTEEERTAIASIRSAAELYAEKLETAEKLVAEGASSREIDTAIKIDDGPALAGLGTLIDIAAQHQAADKNDALSRLRRALGYGGMIHQFKNYVLRQDPPRLAKIEVAIAEARQAIADLQTFDPTDIERVSLDTILHVIDAYETGHGTDNRSCAPGRIRRGGRWSDKDRRRPCVEGPERNRSFDRPQCRAYGGCTGS